MPSFDIIKTTEIDKTFRVSSVLSAFDLKIQNSSEHFKGSIDIEEQNWNIGLIVGASGTGKTTIAKECFGDQMIDDFQYSGKSVIDDMPQNKTIKEITLAFSNVGFSSAPSWLKPYNVLSNGEKMRVDLARGLLQEKELFCFDEYTSVVDRNVAKIGSLALQKSIRRQNRKFIAIGCHYDVIDWLQPDWIFDTNEMRFFFAKNFKNQNWKLRFFKSQVKNPSFGNCLENIII